jgi:hypothetical protein
MESDHKRPLIAHVVWPDAQEVGQLNGFVKKIIKVFIHAVMLRYPSNSKQILGVSEGVAAESSNNVGVLRLFAEIVQFAGNCGEFIRESVRRNHVSVFEEQIGDAGQGAGSTGGGYGPH